ncbi:hypothetical protein GSI_02732 [Ganoderma sinense ZZ0214-1]|uniref:F-box domain-containing protein n=1 Tax=Ganoderma sinense ZZ0214-1 TaxID=1077348 RepID=A0A2G8SMF3_9APHY|nr:hypothetical protein GSI_02732 [Ganoderma sinense ZZ0214-1]
MDADIGTHVGCKGTCLEIRDLPTDVLALVFSLLHGQDIVRCIKVCRGFAELIRSDLYLQYKIELSQNGMVDGELSTLPVSERLQRLREYSSRFRNGSFDREDLSVHPRHVQQVRSGRWNSSSLDERSLSTLYGVDTRFPTTTHDQDGPSDMFLSVFTPGSAEAGIQSSRYLLRISTADEHAFIMTKWAIDGAQDLLVMTEKADISMPEHLRPQPEEFNIRFYSLSGTKTAGGPTPHPDATLPSVRVSAPARTYDNQPLAYVDEVHISGRYVIWALAVTQRDEFRTVIALFVGVCNWQTGEVISLIDVGTHLVHVVPLDYPHFLLVPKAFQDGTYPHLAIYSFESSHPIPSRPICTLLLPEEEYSPGEGTETPWYQVHTGDRPQTSDGHFYADLSKSMVVLTFYHVYFEDNSERETRYLIPRGTLLAQIQAAESRQTQLQTHSTSGGTGEVMVPAVRWADWGPQGCLRLSLQCMQAYRALAMPFSSRLPLFVVDESDRESRSAAVYVFDINPLVARRERQLLAARKQESESAGSEVQPAIETTGIVEDIEAVLPGVVDPDCSSIPYVAYRFPLPSPDAPAEWQRGWFINAVVMGMTGFTIKMAGVEYEKTEQTWTI